MASLVYYRGKNGISFEKMVPQGPPIVENTNPENLSERTIRQIYMCKMSAYKRPVVGSLCPLEISPRVRAVFNKDGPRIPTGIGDIITFERVWIK